MDHPAEAITKTEAGGTTRVVITDNMNILNRMNKVSSPTIHETATDEAIKVITIDHRRQNQCNLMNTLTRTPMEWIGVPIRPINVRNIMNVNVPRNVNGKNAKNDKIEMAISSLLVMWKVVSQMITTMIHIAVMVEVQGAMIMTHVPMMMILVNMMIMIHVRTMMILVSINRAVAIIQIEMAAVVAGVMTHHSIIVIMMVMVAGEEEEGEDTMTIMEVPGMIADIAEIIKVGEAVAAMITIHMPKTRTLKIPMLKIIMMGIVGIIRKAGKIFRMLRIVIRQGLRRGVVVVAVAVAGVDLATGMMIPIMISRMIRIMTEEGCIRMLHHLPKTTVMKMCMMIASRTTIQTFLINQTFFAEYNT